MTLFDFFNFNVKEEENIEYFNGLKPNYIPGTPFVDTEFPPDKSTLAAIDSKTGIKRTPHFLHAKKGLSEEEMETMDFKRPKDIFDKQYYLYKDEINYDDVKQGSLGNCYLISVLAALSQRPQLIKNVFKSKVVNPDGFYELYFYEKNKKKVMYIDDNLVAYKSKFVKEFMFANPNGEELWVMLIEKAYAKFEGGYSNIIGGLMHPEIQFLTGAMAREIQTKDKNCWTEIYNACMGKNILTTGSFQGTGNHFNSTAKGISNGHAYTILDAKEFVGHSMSLRLLKLRNPWGNTEWKGDYSDSCPKWTDELKKFFDYNTAIGDNGVFFMPFDEYTKEFKNIIICCIDSG